MPAALDLEEGLIAGVQALDSRIQAEKTASARISQACVACERAIQAGRLV